MKSLKDSNLSNYIVIAILLVQIGMWVGGINPKFKVLDTKLTAWKVSVEKSLKTYVDVQQQQQLQINDIVKYLLVKDPDFKPYTPTYKTFN